MAEAGKATPGGPDINAALGALAYVMAYLVAKIEHRETRRLALKHIEEQLPGLVAKEVNQRLSKVPKQRPPDGGSGGGVH